MANEREAPSWDGLAAPESREGARIDPGEEPRPPTVGEAFVAVASHELRTPIQAIRLNVGILRTRVESSADEVPRGWLIERLQRTERLVDQMAGLVDRLLNMAEISSGHLELRRETFDLAELARTVVADAEERLRWARCPCDVDAPAAVVGSWDRFRIAMVIENLLANATKYAPGAPVHVRVHAEAGDAVLSVEDEGPGIPRRDRSRLFQRFERGPGRRTVGGFGLGLWIVRTIAEAHGGSVEASTAPGAKFTIRLPKTTAPAPAGSP